MTTADEGPLASLIGLKCSHLVDESTGKRTWFLPQMLVRNKSFANFQLPLTFDEEGRQHRDQMKPKSVVRHIQVRSSSSPLIARGLAFRADFRN